jgi:hypothetical protein
MKNPMILVPANEIEVYEYFQSKHQPVEEEIELVESKKNRVELLLDYVDWDKRD